MAVGVKAAADSAKSKFQAAVQERPRTFEFFGPRLGPSAIMLGLPAVCYGLFVACHQGGCLALRPRLQLPPLPLDLQLFSWEAIAAYLGYILFQVRPRSHAIPCPLCSWTALSAVRNLLLRLQYLILRRRIPPPPT